MPTLHIHCGAPKTGTSYLQVLFARYADGLRAGGIIYPRNSYHDAAAAGGITSGNGVEMANFLNPALPHPIPDKEAFLRQMTEELERADGKDLLYSSEFISFANKPRSERLASAIAEAGYSAHVIYLVRDIGAAALSTYSQQVKRHGLSDRLEGFIRTWDPQYEWNIRCQTGTFGEDSVSIFNYEAEKSRLAELFFRDVLGQDFTPDEISRINRSLTAKELELLRIMNGHFPKGQEARLSTFVSDELMAIPRPGTEVCLSEKEYDLLQSRFSASLSYINARIKGPAIKICEAVVPTRSEASTEEFETMVMAILAKIVRVLLSKA